MLSKFPKIKHSKKDIESANMPDYEKAYRNFSWKNVEKELAESSNYILNAAYIAVDKQAETYRKNKVAMYYEGELGNREQYTFAELSRLSNKFANVLKKYNVARGDRVFIFLPRIPELYISFLGILKLGAIAGTLFSAFQEQALLDRLENSQAKVIVTNAELLSRVQKISRHLPHLEKIILVKRGAKTVPSGNRIVYFEGEMSKANDEFKVRLMNKNDSAFMLYTSGTTGKPKGVIHRHLAIVSAYQTTKWVLDLKEDDVYWCTADPGWVTGIVYGILGVWAMGSSTVVFDGRFSPDRWHKILSDYKVTVWYTAPTAVRMLMADTAKTYKNYDLSNLRHLASVGEPLNPEAIEWGLKAYHLPFHDNWWQTELGSIAISNYKCMDIKPGSMGKPFPGIAAAIVDDKGNELGKNKEGNLAIRPPTPSLMKTIWRRPKKFRSYFVKGWPASNASRSNAGWYISGDKALEDKDGYFWFIGRADDVIKTSGERVGPFEVESALVEHPTVVEAGVIGKPDTLRGEIIKAFVVLKKDVKPSNKLKEDLMLYVKRHLAGHAYPREIEFIDQLPKTRSGKIMRRILKSKEMGLPIGDTSTLEEY